MISLCGPKTPHHKSNNYNNVIKQGCVLTYVCAYACMHTIPTSDTRRQTASGNSSTRVRMYVRDTNRLNGGVSELGLLCVYGCLYVCVDGV